MYILELISLPGFVYLWSKNSHYESYKHLNLFLMQWLFFNF